MYTIPEGVKETYDFIRRMDEVLLRGFAGGQTQDALEALTHLYTGTPLQSRIEEAAQGIAQNAFTDRHFVALAAARVSLTGMLYDVLRAEVPNVQDHPGEGLALTTISDPFLEGVRHWLMEVAIGGFSRLETRAVMAFLPTLEGLRAKPEFVGLGALLTGFVGEMLAALPIQNAADIALFRWCDLWSAAMIQAVGLVVPQADAETVSGMVYPLGFDVRQHPQMFSVVVYAALDDGHGLRLVRQTFSRFTVEAIGSDERWLLLPELTPFAHSLENGTGLRIQEMRVYPSGDMAFLGGETGAAYNPVHVARDALAAGAAFPPLPALFRHPVQLAEPVALTGFKFEEDVLIFPDGTEIAVDVRRDDPHIDRKTTGVFGLMRCDAGRWTLHALTAEAKGKVTFTAQKAAGLLTKPPKTSAVATLEERASRLLRDTKQKASQP